MGQLLNRLKNADRHPPHLCDYPNSSHIYMFTIIFRRDRVCQVTSLQGLDDFPTLIRELGPALLMQRGLSLFEWVT